VSAVLILQVLRVNTKYNVIWVKGQGIAGETNSFVYIYDTRLPLRSVFNLHFCRVKLLIILFVPQYILLQNQEQETLEKILKSQPIIFCVNFPVRL
jgi:hypothetical protein